jgi:hypothetical protein
MALDQIYLLPGLGQVAPPIFGEGDFLLLEDGSYLLLETGDKIKLESFPTTLIEGPLLLEDGNSLLLETGDQLLLQGTKPS